MVAEGNWILCTVATAPVGTSTICRSPPKMCHHIHFNIFCRIHCIYFDAFILLPKQQKLWNVLCCELRLLLRICALHWSHTHTQTQASLCFQFVLVCSLGMNASRETNIKSGGNWFKATVTKVTNGDTISSSCVKANKTHRNKNNYWNCRWWRFRRDKYNEKKKADTFSRSTRFSPPPSNQTSCTCLRFLHIHTFIGGRLLAQNQQQNYKSQQKTQHRHWRNNSFNIIEKSVCLCVCVNSLNPETHREGRRKSFCVLAKFRLSGVIYWKTYECRSHPSTTVRGEFITNNRFSIQRSGRSEKKNDDHKEWEQKNRHIKLISVICVDILLTVCSVKWNRIVGSIETSADGYERFPYNFKSKILNRF